MITINLRPGQKRKRAGGGAAGFLTGLKETATKIKDPFLLAAIAAWVVVLGWLFVTLTSARHELGALQPQIQQAQDENRRYQGLMKQKRDAERIRDSLKAQIEVIRNVDGDRYVWPHILDEMSRALPPYTWLTGLRFMGLVAAADTSDTTAKPRLQFEIQGRTVDIQAYTRLLRQMEASPWIEDVTPLEAKTLVENERAVTGFTIRASFRRADSAYIRTVPLSQSVR